MDQSKKIWKSIYLADAALKFDKNETEVLYDSQTDELKNLKNKISEVETKNTELKSEIDVHDRYLQSVKNSVSLLKESKESLLKEKNDLLKQLELQQIKIDEEKKQQDATLSKYKIMWEQLLSQFHELPQVKEKLDVELKSKKLRIELHTEEREYNDLVNNMKQFVQINDKIFHTQFIQLARACINKREELSKNAQLRMKKDELMKAAESEEKSQLNQPTVMNNRQNVPQTTPEMETNDMMSSLEALSVSFSSFNENDELLKLKALQKELGVDQLFNSQTTYCNGSRDDVINVNQSRKNFCPAGKDTTFSSQFSSDFEKEDGIFKQQMTLTDASRIPVLNKMGFKAVTEKELSSRTNCTPRNVNQLRKISAIGNSTRPRKIMSPKNSRIPVSRSPFCGSRDSLVPEKRISSKQMSANISQSARQISNTHYSSVALTNTSRNISKKKIPSSNYGNSIAPKRKQDNQGFTCQQVAQKVSRKENQLRHTPCRKDFRNTSDQHGKFDNFELHNVTSEEERIIYQDVANTLIVDESNKSQGNLNETYTLDNRQEQMPYGSFDEVNENAEELAFDISPSHPPCDEEMDLSVSSKNLARNQDGGTMSRYFRKSNVNKENTPPQDINQDMDLSDSEREEMFLDKTLQEQSCGDEVRENQYNVSEDFMVSPPRMESQPDDDWVNFSKECSKEKTSSPNCSPKIVKTTNSSSGAAFNFNFSSKPKSGFSLF